MLIDTHAHLNFPDFEKDLEKTIQNSIKNGVEKIVCVSSNLEDSEKAIQIVRRFTGIVFAAIGIHPNITDPENFTPIEKQLETLRDLAGEPEVVAIGECGLDFADVPPPEKKRPKDEQIFFFEEQIKIAKSENLPLVVHSRKANESVLKILREHFNSSNKANGVWHFYSGGKSGIKTTSDLGFYFGLDGNLTYEEGLQNVLLKIPLERIVFETDSPFLSPIPMRGLRNEPANVRIIAEAAAEKLNLSLEELSLKTSQNAQKLFSKIR